MTVTKIVKIDPLHPDHHLVQEAAHIVARGGLVVIPTETVYGIAVNMLDVQAQARLYEIKQRPKNKPFTVHIEEKMRIEEFAGRIPTAAYKLIEKFWPGPLTLLLKSVSGGMVGLRMPDNRVARDIIALARVPVVCPSANLSGKPAPKNFTEAIKDMQGLVDYAIDAGPATLGVESTIVDLTVDPAQFIREGAITKEAISAVINTKQVLFICTGNSCRSVMADAYLRKLLLEKNRTDVFVSSAGIITLPGLGATSGTKQALQQEGIDVSNYHSRGVTKEMIKKSDLILAMEKIHEEHILRMAPEVKNRLFLLKEFAKIDDSDLSIPDPIGKPLDTYTRTLAVIKEAVEKVSNLL